MISAGGVDVSCSQSGQWRPLLYIMGGESVVCWIRQVQVWDVRWERMCEDRTAADIPDARCYHCAVNVYREDRHNFIYLLGGN